MRNIIITKSQFDMLTEGINYAKSGDFGIDVNIDSKQRDIDNKDFDTRLFGTANNILNGDNTLGKRNTSFATKQQNRNVYVKTLEELRAWIEGGRKGSVPDVSAFKGRTRTALLGAISKNDEEALQWIDSTIERVQGLQQIQQNKYERASAANGEDKVARYNVGVVPGTGIKVISLFDFDDFNVSDVLKNGYMRQGEITDRELGIDKNARPLNPNIGKGKATSRNVPITYNGRTPDIEKNFSLNGTEGDSDHFNRVSYGFSDNAYHSIARFIDKSINYAQYALKKEGVQADYIVCAPSSSKFNIYYSKRLQDKTGIPFINGFFSKKLINVHFDREGMENEGISEESINSFEHNVKQAAMKEISWKISAPLKDFVNRHWDILGNIEFDINRPSFRGRKPAVPRPEEVKYNQFNGSVAQKGQVYQIIADSAFEQIKRMIFTPGQALDDNATRVILKELTISSKSSTFDTEKLAKKIGSVISKNCLQDFTQAIRSTAWLIASCHEALVNGFKPNFDGANFKVTKFPKNVRKYLKGAFVIADEQLNKDKNLFTRYAGKKYIIFDEDMNSGATLAMLGDALGDYGIPESSITCLVNGYSSGGF